ncbi:hypothetical protein GIB67_019761 [Kingdonia uniflora]|nr:hypothetical protein GIB67_019761 [Kingdonia uniflora]
MRSKSVSKIGVEDIIGAGLTIQEAQTFHAKLKLAIESFDIPAKNAKEVWRKIWTEKLLEPTHPHALHQLVYYGVYANWDSVSNGPPLYWFPSK